MAVVRDFAYDDDLGGLAATEIDDQLRREFEAGNGEGRIDTAFEAMARIGMDRQATAGLRDVERIPERALDENVDRLFSAARSLAAHDAGHALGTVLVSNDDDVGIEIVGLAVEREQRLAVLGAADREVALHLGCVEDVQRAAAVDRQQIGDVDQRVDGPEADGAELLLQPVRRRVVPDAAHHAQAKQRAELRIVEVEHDLDRARIGAAHRLDHFRRGENAKLRRGEIAGNARYAETIRTVRRHSDLDHRIVEPEQRRERLADRRVLGEVDDAVVLVGETHLALGHHHALRGLTPDLACLENDARAGRHGAFPGEHADHTGTRIRGSADDLHQLAVAGIDLEYAQLVGVRVLSSLDHLGGDEGRERLGAVLDGLDLKADLGQRLGDLIESGGSLRDAP